MMQKWGFRFLAVILLSLYASVEFFRAFSLEAASPYALYGFECAWVVLTWVVFKKVEWRKETLSLRDVLFLLLTLVAGCGVHAWAQAQGIVVPFNLKDPETLVFLLLFGPILEECVFRGAMWRLLDEILSIRKGVGELVILFLTSAVFAYAHYFMIHSVPESFAAFIRYQGVYTLGLGLLCGWARRRFGLSIAILFHLVFNFGFWLWAAMQASRFAE